MVIDYKGVSFSFKDIRKNKRLKRVKLILILFILVAAALLVWNIAESSKIKGIQEKMLSGKTPEALNEFKKIESIFFHRKTKLELKGLFHLLSNNYPAAQANFSKMDGQGSDVEYKKFLTFFADNSNFRSLGIYLDTITPRDKSDDIQFYRALVKTASFDPKQSEDAINHLSPAFKQTKTKELSIIEKLNKQIATGKLNYIFDVNGRPLAYYDLNLKKTISLAPGISFDAFTPEFQQNAKFFHLTLDLAIQEKLHSLFTDLKGTFILCNASDSSIVAAYSKTGTADTQPPNPVFTDRYEPGSIIKIMTMAAFLKSNKKSIFPLECKGQQIIDSKIFYDWTVHNHIASFDDALAVSCNVAFAQMGLDLGYKDLSDTFNHFFFSTDKNAAMSDLFLKFNTGVYNGNISGNTQLANLSVGLNEISISTFHLALISTIISQNGSIYPPYLIKNEKNLMDIGFYNHNAQLLKVFSDNTISNKLKNAMIAAVENPNGTGRRAKVDFVKLALKTGTAGQRDTGLDAILTGFFPAEKPKYSFGFRLAGVGKAELKGALFLKDFLTAFRSTGLK